MLSFLLTVAILTTALGSEGITEGQRHPNVVVIVADDLGIGDLGCYGNDTINTPNIDKLASEGVRLTHHLAASSLCTPSRAAFMTGRYPARYGLVGEEDTPPVIVHVASRVHLPPEEITLGKALSAVNYTTAAVGKWHLGSMCGLFGSNCNCPQIHGFQQFYGLPFSLMLEFRGDHPFWVFRIDEAFYQGLLGLWLMGAVTLISFGFKLKWRLMMILIGGLAMTLLLGLVWFFHTHHRYHTAHWWSVSAWMNQFMNGILMQDDQVIEQPVVLDGLSQKLVNFSVKFIEDHAHDKNPFFLYHSFAHVHTPMFIHPTMAGRSQHGRYGDNVEEMDSGVGSIMAAIADNNLDQNTIVYFISDHGGALESRATDGQRVGGYNGLFKGGKGQGASEGGIRVPGIYRWKDHLPSSVSIDTPTSLMDMMPTILDLAGHPPLREIFSQLPHRELDGMSIAELLLKGGDAPMASRVFIHHCRKSIHALRWTKDEHVYKMFLKRHKYPPGGTQCGWSTNSRQLCGCFGDDVLDITNEPLLFDLPLDPYEDHPIPSNTSEYKEVVAYLKQYLAEWRIRVPYPPSQFSKKMDTIFSFWLQPFCSRC